MANLVWVVLLFIVVFALIAKSPQTLIQIALTSAWGILFLSGVAAVLWELARRM